LSKDRLKKNKLPVILRSYVTKNLESWLYYIPAHQNPLRQQEHLGVGLLRGEGKLSGQNFRFLASLGMTAS
jgi:hypothetical protein